MSALRVTVVGGTGFVGHAIVTALRSLRMSVVAYSAPRYSIEPSAPLTERLNLVNDYAARVRASLPGDLIINAAGMPNSLDAPSRYMEGANALLPAVLARAAGPRPFVHVSSSATQGTIACLDSSKTHSPETAYAATKARGEGTLWALPSTGSPRVVFRPPGVHGPTRSTTRRIAQYARGPLRFTAQTPRNTPQALLPNVASAVGHIVQHIERAPSIVHYPTEGLSTASLLRLLGNREPNYIPDRLATSLVKGSANIHIPRLQKHQSRIRLLLLGQEQAASWLTQDAWQPPCTHRAWKQLGDNIRTQDG